MKCPVALKIIFLILFLIVNQSSGAQDLSPMIMIQNNSNDTAYLLIKDYKSVYIHTFFPLSYKYSRNPFLLEAMPFEMRQLTIQFNPLHIKASQNLLNQLPNDTHLNTCYWYDYQEGQFHYIGYSIATFNKYSGADCGKAPHTHKIIPKLPIIIGE